MYRSVSFAISTDFKNVVSNAYTCTCIVTIKLVIIIPGNARGIYVCNLLIKTATVFEIKSFLFFNFFTIFSLFVRSIKSMY